MRNKSTQSEIYEDIESQIPAALWDAYKHLSFADMAALTEFAEWEEDLLQAEKDWFSASDA
jgi:hypothetical protein